MNNLPKKTRANLRNRGIRTLNNMDLSQFSGSIDLSQNPISTLEVIPELIGFTELNMDDTKIASFYGAKSQPSLLSFSCRNTPISYAKFLKHMAVIVFGDELNYINGLIISKSIKTEAKERRNSLKEYLTNGWILTSVTPMRLIDQQTRKRITIFKENEEKPSVVERSLEIKDIDIQVQTQDGVEEEEEEDQNESNEALFALRIKFNQLVHPDDNGIVSRTTQKAVTREPMTRISIRQLFRYQKSRC